MRCKYCGYQLEENDRFCPECGKEVDLSHKESKQIHIKDNKNKFKIWIGAGIILIVVFGALYYFCSDSDKESAKTEQKRAEKEETSDVIMEDSGVKNIYIAYDESSETYGLYDDENDQYIIEPQYSYIGKFSDNDLAPVCDGGYYGYINSKGEVAIDLFFENAQEFRSNNRAIVGTSNGPGLINEIGDYVITPQYAELAWINDSVLQYKDDENDLYGLCDSNGNIISEPQYESVYAEDEYIYASVEDVTDGYFVYFKDGTPVFGEGTDLEQVKCIKINPYGIHLALCQGNSEPNSYGFYYSDAASYIYDEWYSYLNNDFEMLSYGPYEDAAQFSSFGYAVISIRHDWWGHCTWGIIDKDGAYICDLPELDLGKADNWYTSCNGYFAIARGYTGSYGMETDQITALVNIKTGEVNEYQSVEFVDTTNCTIVQDIETNLYGMYENDTQKLECVYDSIVVDENNNIVTTRGSKQEIIPAEDITQNSNSGETNITPVLIEEALKYMQSNYASDNITELEFYSEENGIISCYVHSSGFTAFIGADINKETKEVKLYNDSGREIDSFVIP